MIKYAFSVLDIKAGLYSMPFFAVNRATAIRDFTYAVNFEELDISRNPEDYVMYLVGSFNDETGVLEKTQPEHIAKASDVVQIIPEDV